MMPFFLTIPISKMMPINAITENGVPKMSSAIVAPIPAEGSVERIVERVNRALIEYPQDDVDHAERREDQQRDGPIDCA